MRKFLLFGLLTLSCQFLPFLGGGSADIKISKSASNAGGRDQLVSFVKDMKKGKHDRALARLNQDSKAIWENRQKIMSSPDKKRFKRLVSKDSFEIDYDQGVFTVVGQNTAPTRIKARKHKGKWRLEF